MTSINNSPLLFVGPVNLQKWLIKTNRISVTKIRIVIQAKAATLDPSDCICHVSILFIVAAATFTDYWNSKVKLQLFYFVIVALCFFLDYAHFWTFDFFLNILISHYCQSIYNLLLILHLDFLCLIKKIRYEHNISNKIYVHKCTSRKIWLYHDVHGAFENHHLCNMQSWTPISKLLLKKMFPAIS